VIHFRKNEGGKKSSRDNTNWRKNRQPHAKKEVGRSGRGEWGRKGGNPRRKRVGVEDVRRAGEEGTAKEREGSAKKSKLTKAEGGRKRRSPGCRNPAMGGRGRSGYTDGHRTREHLEEKRGARLAKGKKE